MTTAKTHLPSDEHFTLFRRFAIGRQSRQLWANGKALSLNERATELLITLIDAGGRIVSIEQLQQHVWPEVPVSANSVQALVSQLRNVLGDDRDVIETVPRRGYRFGAERCDIREERVSHVSRSDADDPKKHTLYGVPPVGTQDEQVVNGFHNAGRQLLIGRDAEISELLMLVPKHRLITLTSAGGNGKTCLAREVALRTATMFRDGVFYVELAELTLPELIPDAIAAQIPAFSLNTTSGLDGLVEQLTGRETLLIIDDCDHLAHEIAMVVDALLSATKLCMIVCAEAPLFIAGEYVTPLAPLRFWVRSTPDTSLDVQNAPPSDASRMLIAQLEECGVWFANDTGAATLDSTRIALPNVTQSMHPQVDLESVCRALCGNPLALAVAARQIAYTMRGRTALGKAIDDWKAHWRRLMQHRTGSGEVTPRPATLVSSVVAMAYDKLDASTQRVLCCVSLIAGSFDFADARAICLQAEESRAPDKEDTLQVVMSNLIDAGLMDEYSSNNPGRLFEVPKVVRRFALETLRNLYDQGDLSKRHAQWVVEQIGNASCPDSKHAAGPASYLHHNRAPSIGDIRRALGFSVHARYIQVAAQLLRHSAPIWVAARLSNEWLAWTDRVLKRDFSRPTLKVRDHMLLHLSLAESMQHAMSTTSADTIAAWWRVYELATACADDENRLQALALLLMRSLEAGFNGDSPELLMQVRTRIAHECASSSRHRGFALLRGALLTFDGRHDDAISLFSPPDEKTESVSGYSNGKENETYYPDYVAVVSDNALAMSLWLTGAHSISHPTLLRALQGARQQSDPVARCAAEMMASVLFLLEGNTQRVAQHARLLLEVARCNGLHGWTSIGHAFLQWTRAIDETHDEARKLTQLALDNLARGHTTIVDLVALERFSALALNQVCGAVLIRQFEQMITNLRNGGRKWLIPEAMRVYAIMQHRAGLPKENVRAALEQAAYEARQQRTSLLWRRISATIEQILPSRGTEAAKNITRT
ncbi:winged helix-turn-helix domain-containing protein [Burkholderia sp. AU6039]|uniref:ATP-binding protein n=1 Tax=Burkholderia sp. AU6039 TaxID=2015344 RepID=UPI000B7ACEA3|nr:winged helix-turn-helix domain-containing protein [Burkholderia sp. AU6039]OXJ06788.1 hypothetical protein CFB39_38250 [Burkholderia sp. AU6039]